MAVLFIGLGITISLYLGIYLFWRLAIVRPIMRRVVAAEGRSFMLRPANYLVAQIGLLNPSKMEERIQFWSNRHQEVLIASEVIFGLCLLGIYYAMFRVGNVKMGLAVILGGIPLSLMTLSASGCLQDIANLYREALAHRAFRGQPLRERREQREQGIRLPGGAELLPPRKP